MKQQATPELHAFFRLGPEQVIADVEGIGLRCDGHLLALNSYENRVYQVGLENGAPVIAKFYRPGRWSDAAIREEHDFTKELAALDIPAAAPISVDGETLFHADGFRFAVYPRCAGAAAELDDRARLSQLGRHIGRMHALGACAEYRHRPKLTVEHFGHASCQFVLECGLLPAELEAPYRHLCDALLRRIEAAFESCRQTPWIRIHGDCHAGNILWHAEHGVTIVDFDDSCMGPAVQDLWMFLSGSRNHMESCLAALLHGYTQFYEFDVRQLRLIEPLRTLRMMHYAAWLARRWDDPAFREGFPWFGETHFWHEHLQALQDQADALREEPLRWI